LHVNRKIRPNANLGLKNAAYRTEKAHGEGDADAVPSGFMGKRLVGF
jgi:hypothetical protein